MRRLTAVVLTVASVSLGMPAFGQGMSQEQYRTSFNEASRCFAVLAYARKDRLDHGDRDRASFYDAKARDAFNAAFAAGRLSGRSVSQVEADIYKLSDGEFPKIVGDVAYYRAAAARCKAIGYL